MKYWIILILSLNGAAGCSLMPTTPTCPTPGKIEIRKAENVDPAATVSPYPYGMDKDSMAAVLLYIRDLEAVAGCD